MKLSDFTKNLSSIEITALVVFVIYIIFPFKTPSFLVGIVNTPFGLLVLLVVTLFLFFYTNPLLGVVYIFVAYELVRRTSLVKNGVDNNYIVRSSESENEKAAVMNKMNPVANVSLEEEIVSKMAPSQVFHSEPEINTGFKPVVEKVKDASLFV